SGPRWKALEAKFQVVSLDGEYTRLRINNKSEEEIAWLRVGAALSDAGMAALVGGTKPGMTEHEIGNMIERAYVGVGGTNVIHFLGTTQMAAPDVCVPRQFTSRRKVQAGDFVFCVQELIDASGIIEKNGFTTNDDLVHGYGGGYFAPILGSKSIR